MVIKVRGAGTIRPTIMQKSLKMARDVVVGMLSDVKGRKPRRFIRDKAKMLTV